MSHYYERNDSGYTRGGLDVVTGINLFFKGILIFPILVLATYLGLAMVKHMIFQGVPTMNQPTEEQREAISQSDHRNWQMPWEVETEEQAAIAPPAETSTYSAVASNCQYSPVCPPGGEARVGANGLPYVWPTTEAPVWNTEIEEDPFH